MKKILMLLAFAGVASVASAQQTMTVTEYEVIQVQDTRQLTANLNEVNRNIENQSRESLLLQAQRQSLSAHSFIREQAIQKLGMVNPKTEAEVVIRLDH